MTSLTSIEALERAFDAGEPAVLALARARAYVLFAAFVRRGLCAETVGHAEDLPELAPALEGYRRDQRLDLEAAAAGHQHVFGHEVFPWASVFLDVSGRPGGKVAEAVYADFQRLGLPCSPTHEGADHLAVLLEALAFLSSAEAEAWSDGQSAVAEGVRTRAAELVQAHLWSWWAPLRAAVRGEAEPFSEAVLELVEQTVCDHVGVEAGPLPPREAPTLLERLDDPKVGLRDIAAELLVPIHSGVFLSRSHLRTLGRSLGLPLGFGRRVDRLETFLRSAAEADVWPGAIAALDRTWSSVGQAYLDLPGGAPWRGRVEETRAVFSRMQEKLTKA